MSLCCLLTGYKLFKLSYLRTNNFDVKFHTIVQFLHVLDALIML